LNKQKTKKVLLISYYWPPCGGIGVLRCLKIAKYLRDFGWEPIVYTAEDAHYPSLDPSNEKDIPEGITILKGKIWEPYHLYKFITGQKKDANVNNVFYVKDQKLNFFHQLSVWVRSNFFIPDARALWIKPSVKLLVAYLKEHPVDAIFSDGPPHSNTRIATLVKRATGIPWLADFQDPWTQVDYYQLLNLTKWGNQKHHRLEQEAFQTADKTTIVSPTWKKDLEAIGAKNVSVIPWGYDPEDFDDLKAEVSTQFQFTHLGIMGYDRNPSVFFETCSEIAAEEKDFAKALQIQLVGQVDYSVQESYTQHGLKDNAVLTGQVNRDQALQLAANSPILLLLLNQQDNAKGRIPGKLFEYLATRRTILVLGPTDSDVAAIVRSTQSGYCCAYDDQEGIKKVLLTLYEQYKSGALQEPRSGDIEQYSIRHLTGKIAGFLDTITP
jgi:hypothetical protein